MAKGDGSITKLGSNKYRIQISYGKDPITGKYKRVTKVVNGTKAEARKVRDQIRKERESGVFPDGGKLTFREFAKTFLEIEEASGKVSIETMKDRASKLKYICGFIGDMKLRDINPQVVEATMAAIKRDRTEKKGGIRNSTLRNYYGQLRKVLQKAVDYELIARNPCDKVKPPVAESVNRRSLDASEASRLLAFVDKCEREGYAKLKSIGQKCDGWPTARLTPIFRVSFAMCVRIGLATGMRIGEVLGLLWDCVDFDRGAISVRRSISKYGRLKEPKTKAGARTISLDEKTLKHLKIWRREQAVVLAKIGVEQTCSTPVCCNGFGRPMAYANFLASFDEFRKEVGFPDLKFHELRHTQASLLLANGVDVKTVQDRLGHTSASITLNTYAHAMPENDKKAADLIGSICAAKEPRIIKVKTA